MVSLQVTQKELKGAREELKETDSPTERSREVARARRFDGEGGGSEPGKLAKHRRYENCVQGRFHCLTTAVHDRILQYAKPETSGLRFDWENVAESWKSGARLWGRSERRVCLC